MRDQQQHKPSEQHRTTIAKNPAGVWCVYRWRVTVNASGQTVMVPDGHERTATDEDWLALGGVRKAEVDLGPREPNPDMQALIQKLVERPPERFRAEPSHAEKKAKYRAECRATATQARIPAMYLDRMLDPEDRPAIRAMRTWEAGTKQALLLSGANQCGKSFAAAAWLATVPGSRWTTASEIGSAVQPPSQMDYLRDLRGAAALVIDNLGERCGPGGYEEIEAQIMYQISRGHRIIVTTDWAPRDVWGLFGDATHNRILARWKLVGEVQTIGPWGTR